MAINYTTLFTRLGRLVKVSNDLIAEQNVYRGIGTQSDDILDEYADRRDLVEGLLPAFDGLASQMAAQVGQLKAVADRTLGDLQLELNATSDSPTAILPRLYEQMVEDSETVDASAISAPTITSVSGNTGNGTLVASKVDALGRDVETSITETVRFICTADQWTGGTAGGETFSVTGWPEIDPNTYGTRGNGNGSDIRVADNGGQNLLTNGDFETFTTANTPDSWTIDAGAVGTNIFEGATVHAEDSTSSLELQGNSSAATITLSQSIATLVDPVTRYAAGVWIRKGAGTLAAGSTLTVRVTGTGFSAVNLFNADPDTLTTTFALKSAFFSTPEAIPDDLKIEITWTSASGVANTGEIFFDDFAAVPAYEFGGLYYAIFRGSADFTERDAFTSETVNDGAGVFNEYMSRFYGFQLPSDGAGGETIDDALAS